MAKKANAAAVAAADHESATTQVNIADFQRTRDSVIVALATLQSSVQDLSRAYINHANTVLAPGRGGELNSNLTNILTESGLLAGSTTQLPVVVDAAPEAEGKKKRKRVPHDPNAPKRALTPYFLYMQSARTQIAKELGDNAKPKEVADEGTRRWTEMAPTEKHVWDELYQKNLAVYRVRMAAYKAGQPVPEDAEAVRLVEAGKAPAIIAELQSEEEAEEAEPVEEEEESSPEPVKEPSPPKSKRRKSEKVTSPVAKETPKSVTKAAAAKSKKAAAAKKEASPAPEPASTSKPSEKKKRGKKA